MPQNIVTDKIKDLFPGQILAHYKFFLVQEEKSFSLYKNDQNFFIFVFQSPNNDLLFIETLEFKVLDKISLFYFLAERLEMDSILVNIKNILQLEDFDRFQFSDTIAEKVLIDLYYRLEKSEFLEGTPLEKYAFKRDGSDVILFKDLHNSPIDVVSFLQNNEEVFSEFGNNFGSHFIKNPNSNKTLISFHPDLIFKNDNRELYNIFITKYQVPLFDILSILKREELKEVYIPVNGIFSYIFKLQILLKFHNFFDPKVRFELNISSNNFFAELYFTLNGDSLIKLEIINHVAALQNALKKVFVDHSESIKDNIYNSFAFKVDIHSEGQNHCGKIVFRNNITLLSIVIDSFQNKINGFENTQYTFV